MALFVLRVLVAFAISSFEFHQKMKTKNTNIMEMASAFRHPVSNIADIISYIYLILVLHVVVLKPTSSPWALTLS